MASTVLRVSITLHRTSSNKEPFVLGSSRTNLANLFLPRRPPPRLAALTLSSTPRDRAVTSKNINKKKRTPKNVGEDEDIEEGAFEALFRQLEEDLKNDKSLGNSGVDDDGGGGGGDDDDDISEEEVAKLEQELSKALDVDDETENEDEEEDDDKSRQEPSNLEQGLGEIWKELAKYVGEDDEIENEGEDDDETKNEEEDDDETESEDEDEEEYDISEELRKLGEELDKLDQELAEHPEDDDETENEDEDEDEDDISEELRQLDEELDKLDQELAKPDDETENEDEEDDDDISEEKLRKLDKELVEPQKDDKLFGALDSVACEQTEPEDEEEDDEDGCEEVDDDDDEEEEEEEEETPIKLKNWQLKRLAYALKNGRRKTRIKTLAADLCLDRAVVLELLRDPPPSVVMLSATLPDKPASTIWSPEEKPVETVPLETMENTETPEVKENLPIHVMQSNWSARKRLKKVQLGTLEQVYKRTKRPTNSVISSIVHVTNLPRKKVVKWFEDKRGEEGVPERRLPYQRPDPEPVSTS